MPKITDEPVDEKFGIRFRTAWLQSKFRDLNQKELSQKFGYSQQGMSFIANGHRYPHLSTGLKIAKNLTVQWIGFIPVVIRCVLGRLLHSPKSVNA